MAARGGSAGKPLRIGSYIFEINIFYVFSEIGNNSACSVGINVNIFNNGIRFHSQKICGKLIEYPVKRGPEENGIVHILADNRNIFRNYKRLSKAVNSLREIKHAAALTA